MFVWWFKPGMKTAVPSGKVKGKPHPGPLPSTVCIIELVAQNYFVFYPVLSEDLSSEKITAFTLDQRELPGVRYCRAFSLRELFF